jgi:uncharacterized protein (UPF0264 family)
MTQLLVSVRSAEEAAVALASGAGLIDVKEPSRGPLGGADPATIRRVVRVVAGRLPVSAALGELRQFEPGDAARLPAGVGYVKLGLSGCRADAGWAARWREVSGRLPPEVTPVGVVYADWPSCNAPEPDRIVAEAAAVGCGAVLVDTFDKTAGGLFDHRTPDELAHFVHTVQMLGMLAVVAGSLTEATMAPVLATRPDYVAVRGAACRGGRLGVLEAGRIRRLADFITRAERPETRASCGNCLTIPQKSRK